MKNDIIIIFFNLKKIIMNIIKILNQIWVGLKLFKPLVWV